MGPILKDSPNKGHHITTSLQRTPSKAPKIDFLIVLSAVFRNFFKGGQD